MPVYYNSSMYKTLVSLFLFTAIHFGKAQDLPLNISGVISEVGDSTKFIENAKIYIIQKQDTLAMVKSDSLGKYIWKSKVASFDTLTISVQNEYFFENSTTLSVGTYPIEVFLKLILIPKLIEYLPNIAYYEENVVDSFSGFNLASFKHSLEKFETYCIRFTHVSFSNESKLIAEQRKANFKQYLIDNGVNIDHIHFTPENLTLKCTTDDCRGRINGEVISINNNCD